MTLYFSVFAAGRPVLCLTRNFLFAAPQQPFQPLQSVATDTVTVEPLRRKTRSTLFTAGANLVPVAHQGAPGS